MIIDAHIHLFPDPIAQRAIPHLASICKSPAFTDGTLAQTEQKLREWGVDIGVAMHIATKPSQQKSVNTWPLPFKAGRLLCFGSVHPDAEDWPEALQYIKNAGLRGIKMHPDYQDFFIDDKRLFPIYDAIAALELPVTFHAGWDPLSPDCVHASPAAIKKIAKLFPKIKNNRRSIWEVCAFTTRSKKRWQGVISSSIPPCPPVSVHRNNLSA